jgi:hypothetical protein
VDGDNNKNFVAIDGHCNKVHLNLVNFLQRLSNCQISMGYLWDGDGMSTGTQINY